MSELRRVKVAVIGTGLAGLTAGHLLTTTHASGVEFEVHLFEKVRGLFFLICFLLETTCLGLHVGHGLVFSLFV